MNDWYVLLPICFTVFTGIIILLLEVFLSKEARKGLLPAFATTFLIFDLILSFYVYQLAGKTPFHIKPVGLDKFFVFDGFTAFFYFFFIATTILCVLSSPFYLKRESLAHGEYYALLFFALAGMMLMASSTELMTLFVSLEIMSMSIYILVGFQRYSARSNEAALKYFFLGAFASAILLYGIALLYGSLGTTELDVIHTQVQNHINPLTGLSLILILIGLGFKIAAVPFHMWTPEAYEGAPMPITGFMAVAVKGAGIAILLRIMGFGLLDLKDHWGTLIWVLAIASMFIGNIFAFAQHNVKRMLAYSSVVHSGYLLMGLMLMKSNDNQALSAILYYLVAYGLATMGTFAALTYLSDKREQYVNFSDYSGLSSEYPLIAAGLSLFMFSYIGIPPLAGFFGKYYLFSNVLQEGYFWLTTLAILNSVLSIYYYLKLVVVMYMQPTSSHWKEARPRPPFIGSVIAYSSFGVIWAGVGTFNMLWIFPGFQPLIHWLQQVVLL